jgi:uracil-DNA glycosylase family 4
MASVQSDIVKATGPVPCKGMIVGEAPGREESVQGMAFVGPSGRLLDSALEASGVSRKDVYVTNAYKTRPPGNRNPLPEELESHRPLFHKELKDVQPHVILALGRVAFDYLRLGSKIFDTGSSRMGEARLRTFETFGSILLVTWHPAYILRNSRAKPEFLDDVKRFVEVMNE